MRIALGLFRLAGHRGVHVAGASHDAADASTYHQLLVVDAFTGFLHGHARTVRAVCDVAFHDAGDAAHVQDRVANVVGGASRVFYGELARRIGRDARDGTRAISHSKADVFELARRHVLARIEKGKCQIRDREILHGRGSRTETENADVGSRATRFQGQPDYLLAAAVEGAGKGGAVLAAHRRGTFRAGKIEILGELDRLALEIHRGQVGLSVAVRVGRAVHQVGKGHELLDCADGESVGVGVLRVELVLGGKRCRKRAHAHERRKQRHARERRSDAHPSPPPADVARAVRFSRHRLHLPYAVSAHLHPPRKRLRRPVCWPSPPFQRSFPLADILPFCLCSYPDDVCAPARGANGIFVSRCWRTYHHAACNAPMKKTTSAAGST